ncbi:MAG: collagenase [Bacilli bacterium]|nr:collagenase [Bacilli bacterium]
MDFDLKIKNNNLTIYCSNGLENFSNEFINYYNENIEKIKEELSIDQDTKIIVALTDDEAQAGFVYGKSSFSGFFNDTGAFAYINLNGNKTKEYMFKGLIHELVHHLYKYYVYGKDNERITWVDEGLAQFFSGQKDDLKDDKTYKTFLEENLEYSTNIDLNKLNHNDRSFGNKNGYNLSYIAIRYLYETYNHEEFINIIKSKEKLLEIGNTILERIKENKNTNKTI